MTLRRLPGIAVFTLVEVVTLGIWLDTVTGTPTLSTLAAVGAGVLVAGLVVEALVNTVVVNGFSEFPLAAITTFSITEALIWILWLGVAEELGGLRGIGIAGVVLFVLMLPQHSLENNALRGRSLFSNVVELGTVAFTFVEAAGGTLWLAFVFEGDRLLDEVGVQSIPALDAIPAELGASVGLVVLAVALFVEHVMGTQFALRMGRSGEGV